MTFCITLNKEQKPRIPSTFNVCCQLLMLDLKRYELPFCVDYLSDSEYMQDILQDEMAQTVSIYFHIPR